MRPFDFHLRTRVVFGEGALSRLGELARELGFTRTLHRRRSPASWPPGWSSAAPAIAGATRASRRASFHDFDANPDSANGRGGPRAWPPRAASTRIVALGGGSSLDCAKGINFVLTNGGTMRDYRGYGKAARPMLPMIGVPTTAGTGSEAQSYAIISDPVTHEKMACGDPRRRSASRSSIRC